MSPDTFRDQYRSPPVPPRTSFVAPWVFFHIVKRHHAMAAICDLRGEGGDCAFVQAADGPWRIVSDPDCPVDYTWPEVTPAAVAEVIREGIADAKAARGAAP